MAGGVFGRPFELNIKCIIFSLVCMSLFLYKPEFKRSTTLYFVLFLIFVVAYVSMAWYDYYFNCDIVPLRKGYMGGITGQLKPESHMKAKQEDGQVTAVDKYREHMLIYASHLLFIVPLLGYVAIYRQNIRPAVYPILGALAVFTAAYHGIHLMTSSHAEK